MHPSWEVRNVLGTGFRADYIGEGGISRRKGGFASSTGSGSYSGFENLYLYVVMTDNISIGLDVDVFYYKSICHIECIFVCLVFTYDMLWWRAEISKHYILWEDISTYHHQFQLQVKWQVLNGHISFNSHGQVV